MRRLRGTIFRKQITEHVGFYNYRVSPVRIRDFIKHTTFNITITHSIKETCLIAINNTI